jgi:hypothetical protein
LEEIRKIIRTLHPELKIDKLYKDHAELNDADSSVDWATETRNRCQVCCTIEAEITPEEGKGDEVIREGIMSVSWGAGLIWVANGRDWKEKVEVDLGLSGKNWQLDKADPDRWEQGDFQVKEMPCSVEVPGVSLSDGWADALFEPANPADTNTWIIFRGEGASRVEAESTNESPALAEILKEAEAVGQSESKSSLQMEPEKSSSEELIATPNPIREDPEEEQYDEEEETEEQEELDESFKFAPFSGPSIIEDAPAIMSALMAESTPTPKSSVLT